MITSQRPVNVHTIERYLLLASDLPGLHFNASLKPSKTHEGASTLVIEMTEKPINVYARGDNRGTPSRGMGEWLLGADFNNLLHKNESFTVNWASVGPDPKELQYFAGNYRQVLTAEGVYAFVNGSYNTGRPGTDVLRLLDFKAWGSYVEGGFAGPVIRTRETNLTLTGLVFAEDSLSDILQTPFNRDHLRGLRLKADADWADRFLGINQVNFTYSQGIQGLGSSENNDPLQALTNVNNLSNPVGRVDFEKAEAIVEFRYDLPKFADVVTQTQFYTYSDYGKLWVRGPGVIDPTTGGISGNFVAASAGGGVRLAFWDKVTADLSVAKAIEGPRDDTRFFFIVGAKY